MRPWHAFTLAMRTRRTRRIDLDEADRLVAGDTPGPGSTGLGNLLDALRAPAQAGELDAEKATVAAFSAHRTRAAETARRSSRTRTRPTRVIAIPFATALALLSLGGTAWAARTGNLPDAAQQHAHRLFSALGVPAPRTGPTPAASHSLAPSPSGGAPAEPTVLALGWCADWEPGGPALSTDDHRRLRVAAGGEAHIPGYCDRLRSSATPPVPTPTSTPPSRQRSATPSPSTHSDRPPPSASPSGDRQPPSVRPAPAKS